MDGGFALIYGDSGTGKSILLRTIEEHPSTKLDSQVVLSVILPGDKRLLDKFRSPSLLPLGIRIKTRIQT